MLFTYWSSALGHLHDKEEAPSQLKLVGVQASGGVFAGAVTSFVTTPIDTIKTRLQVLCGILFSDYSCNLSCVGIFCEAYPCD